MYWTRRPHRRAGWTGAHDKDRRCHQTSMQLSLIPRFCTRSIRKEEQETHSTTTTTTTTRHVESVPQVLRVACVHSNQQQPTNNTRQRRDITHQTSPGTTPLQTPSTTRHTTLGTHSPPPRGTQTLKPRSKTTAPRPISARGLYMPQEKKKKKYVVHCY